MITNADVDIVKIMALRGKIKSLHLSGLKFNIYSNANNSQTVTKTLNALHVGDSSTMSSCHFFQAIILPRMNKALLF